MRRTLLTLCSLSCLAPSLASQVPKYDIACYADRKENPPRKQKLQDGYEISLGPARNSPGDGDNCTAAIYNSAGKVVFRTIGFSVLFDHINTGKDFDGDGHPEVVFKTDSGGGMHCCWAYNIVSLYPKPRRLFDIDEPARIETDSQDKIIIWKMIAGPYGFTSMARQPFAKKVYRVRAGRLVEQTLDFCPRILSDQDDDYREDTKNLTPENIKRLQSSEETRNDTEDTVSALLSRALQHVFCRQFDHAITELNLWPAATRTKMKAAFADSVEKDYPEFAARLVQPLKNK
jgi:hypothetical protein